MSLDGSRRHKEIHTSKRKLFATSSIKWSVNEGMAAEECIHLLTYRCRYCRFLACVNTYFLPINFEFRLLCAITYWNKKTGVDMQINDHQIPRKFVFPKAGTVHDGLSVLCQHTSQFNRKYLCVHTNNTATETVEVLRKFWENYSDRCFFIYICLLWQCISGWMADWWKGEEVWESSSICISY